MTPHRSRVDVSIILSVLLASSFPASADETKAQGSSPQSGVPATVTDSKVAAPPAGSPDAGTVNILDQISARFKQKPDEENPRATDAIYGYMADVKNGYVNQDVLKDKGDVQIKALVRTWVDINAKDDAKVGKLSILYLNISDPKGDLKALLGKSMAPWASQVRSADGPGQLGGTNQDKWVNAFLDMAASEAAKIMTASRLPKKDWTERVIRDDAPPPVTGGPNAGDKRSRGDISNKRDWNYLYREGAEVLDLYQEGDTASRQIAIKMSTRKEPDGKLVNEIRIYDVTDPAMGKPQPWDIFSQAFDIDPDGGSSTFALDARTPGKKKYTLTMNKTDDGDVRIVFSREGVQQNVDDQDGAKKGNQIFTSYNKLAQLRAGQAVAHRDIVTIGGQDFFSLGAGGGGYGQLCYFPLSIAEKTGTKKPSELTPALMANVTQFVGGKIQPVSANPDLGKVDGKPYHMEYNSVTFNWEVKPGEGDKPKPPTGGDDKKPGKPGEGGGGGTDKPNPPAGGAQACDPGGNIANTGYYSQDTGSTKGLPEGLVCIFKTTEKGEKELLTQAKNAPQAYMMHYQMTIPGTGKNFYVPFQPRSSADMKYALGNNPIRALKAGDKYYLVTESDGGVTYLDLQNFEGEADAKSFAKSGSVAFKPDMDIQALTDKALLADAMAKAGFSNTEVTNAKANLAKALPEDVQAYSIGGHKTTALVVSFSGKGQAFWPTIKDAPPADPNHKDTQSGNPFDKDISAGPFQGFQSDPIVDGATLSILKRTDSAALYVNDVAAGKGTKEKPRRYYLMFGFVNNAGNKVPMRTKFIEVFSDGNPDMLQFPKSDYGIDGLMKHHSELDLMSSGVNVRFLGDPKNAPKKGVYAGFATRAENPRDKKANCLGPVLWWGTSREDAQEACEKGQ